MPQNDKCIMCLNNKAQYLEKEVETLKIQYCFKCWFYLADCSYENWQWRLENNAPTKDFIPLVFNREKII
jgi:hypothetical protein